MLNLNEYYLALAKINNNIYDQVLPSQELDETAKSASEDFEEDVTKFNQLVDRLTNQSEKDDIEVTLVEIVALASGIEGLLSNICEDARDLLRGKYRIDQVSSD